MKGIVEEDLPRVRELLSRVFAASDYRHIERLGGLTNHTYRVLLESGDAYVVRLPGEGTEELINRADEKVSTQLACRLGIDARMLLFGAHGEKVSDFIEGAQTMSQEAFASPAVMEKAAEVLHTLHTCGEDTGVRFDVFDMASGYEAILSSYGVALFDGYEAVRNEVMSIRADVSHYGVPNVPCHNDPLCENWVLSSSGQLYLIDWEYAGMNDAMWDLADVSIEAAFTAEQDAAFLRHYFGRAPEYHETLRFCANKLYLDYLWALWGKARVPFDGEPMEQYGKERFDRLKRNLALFREQFPNSIVRGSK